MEASERRDGTATEKPAGKNANFPQKTQPVLMTFLFVLNSGHPFSPMNIFFRSKWLPQDLVAPSGTFSSFSDPTSGQFLFCNFFIHLSGDLSSRGIWNLGLKILPPEVPFQHQWTQTPAPVRSSRKNPAVHGLGLAPAHCLSSQPESSSQPLSSGPFLG